MSGASTPDPSKTMGGLPLTLNPGSSILERRREGRVTHACEPCRARKTRCDGNQPSCGHCVRLLINCVYADGKREQQKRRMKALEDRLTAYKTLLSVLQGVLDPINSARIQEMLDWGSSESRESPPEIRVEPVLIPTDPESESRDPELKATIAYGPVDSFIQDMNLWSVGKSTGFMGRGSEISWIRILRIELGLNPFYDAKFDAQGGDPGSGGEEKRDVCATYHLDDVDLALRGSSDTYAVPPKHIADMFLAAYFITVHPHFPIISRHAFMEQYDLLYAVEEEPQPNMLSNYWLAIINLVFSIGRRFYETMGRQMDYPHLEFFMRSRILGALDGGALFAIPTLQDVQALGLTGMYLVASKHTNRGWGVVGLALRLAQSLGLYVLHDDARVRPDHYEMRIRVWSSILYLESTLCLVTGRPTALQLFEDSPIYSAPSNRNPLSSRLFECYHSLAITAARVQTQLYTPQSPRMFARDVAENTIAALEQRLDHWKDKLPPEFELGFHDGDGPWIRQRIDLAFRYLNIMILVLFPPLTWISSPNPSEFAQTRSKRCIWAAQEILNILIRFTPTGHDPETAKLVWWCIQHYACTAETIKMIWMVQQIRANRPIPQKEFDDARKPLEWLHYISRTDLAAKRAYIQLTRLLDQVERMNNGQQSSAGIQVVNAGEEWLDQGMDDVEFRVQTTNFGGPHGDFGPYNMESQQERQANYQAQ